MRTKQFWFDVLERALKTAAQSMLTIVMVDTVIWELNWVEGLGIAATQVVASVLTSIMSSNIGDPESAALMTSPGRHRADPNT